MGSSFTVLVQRFTVPIDGSRLLFRNRTPEP